MTAHEIHALSGAYAVDALDDVERARFEKHLDVCAECRAEVAELRETGALLSELSATAPPPALRDRLLAEIRTTRPLPPVAPEVAPVAAPQGKAPRRIRWSRLAAAAAIFTVVGVGTTVVVDEMRDSPSQTLPAVDRVLSAADAEGVNVLLSNGARLRVVRSASEGRAVLVTRDLGAPPAGKVYELWLQDADGNMVPAGLFEGTGNQRVLLEGNAAKARAAGITVEPAGGSPQPTTKPIALFDFEKAT